MNEIIEQECYEQGYSANHGLTHRLVDNPYMVNTVQHHWWVLGWVAYSKEFTDYLNEDFPE